MGKGLISRLAVPLVPLGLAALMVACSDTETYYADDFRNRDKEFGESQNGNSSEASPAWEDTALALEGSFNLASFLEPVELEISSLDGNLKKLESVSARVIRNRIDFSYKAPELKFPTPYAELDFVCRYRDSKDTSEMHFTAYADLSAKNATGIDLYRALESGYLKELVQKQGEPFALARKHAHAAIHDLLDPEREYEYGVENAPYGNDTLEVLAYHYGLFFLRDTVFYRNFKKLYAAVGGKKKWDEVLSPKTITDRLIEHYRLDESRCDSAVFAELEKDAEFTQLRYDAALWIVGDTAACVEEIPRDTSEVADTTAKDTLHEMTPAEVFGECSLNREHQKVMLEKGKYFECLDKEWTPIMSPAYYEDRGEEGDIITRDGEYFVCGGDYYWRLLKDEEIVPPVKDLRKCLSNEIAQYGETIYRCDFLHHRWYELPEDSIAQYQKNGVFCMESNEGRIEEVDGTYWICHHEVMAWGLGEYRSWTKLSFTDSVLYVFNKAHQGDCKNGRTGTTVYWNEPMSTRFSSHVYFLCDDTYSDWGYDYIGIGSREDYDSAALDGGVFIDDTTFVARHGEYTYTVVERVGWSRIFDIDNVTASIDGKEYGVLFRKQQPYLSGRRGEAKVLLDSVSGKSTSFDTFMGQYTHSESAYPAFGSLFVRPGEDTYMDWEKASTFCPAGYHVPDTSEWTADFLEAFPVEARDGHDSPVSVRYNATTYLYDIYWTSASKDSETHYCYEIRYENDNGPLSRIIECPDELYPGVQTLCFKDGEGH